MKNQKMLISYGTQKREQAGGSMLKWMDLLERHPQMPLCALQKVPQQSSEVSYMQNFARRNFSSIALHTLSSQLLRSHSEFIEHQANYAYALNIQ